MPAPLGDSLIHGSFWPAPSAQNYDGLLPNPKMMELSYVEWGLGGLLIGCMKASKGKTIVVDGGCWTLLHEGTMALISTIPNCHHTKDSSFPYLLLLHYKVATND